MNQGPSIITPPRQRAQEISPTRAAAANGPAIDASEKAAMQYVMQLAPSERAEYLKVRAALQNNPEAAKLLDQLLVRQVGSPPHSAALDLDHTRKTLLASLAELTTKPLFDSELESRRSEIITAALRNLVHPEDVTQSRSACCTVTNALRDEARKNPAEYMMMLSNLVRTGETRLRSGSTMYLNNSSVSDDISALGGARYMQRDIADRILQSAAIEFGNGDLQYNCQNDSSSGSLNDGRGKNFQVQYGGLYDHQFERFLEALNGRAYRSVYDNAEIMQLLQSRREGTYVNMTYASKGQHANHAVKIINEPNQEPGWIYYENPWGPISRENWRRQDGPEGRELVDPARGIERIRVGDAAKRIFVAFVDDAKATRGVDPSRDRSLLGDDLSNRKPYGPTGFDYTILGQSQPKQDKPVEKAADDNHVYAKVANTGLPSSENPQRTRPASTQAVVTFPAIGAASLKLKPAAKVELFETAPAAPAERDRKVEPQQSIYFSNERDINSTRVSSNRINAAPGSLMAAAQRVRFSTAA